MASKIWLGNLYPEQDSAKEDGLWPLSEHRQEEYGGVSFITTWHAYIAKGNKIEGVEAKT